MGGFAACTGIVIMIIIVVLTIPLSYELSLQAGTPFRFKGKIHWLGHAFLYEWSYEDGKLPEKKYFLHWQNQIKDTAPSPGTTKTPETPAKKQAENAKAAWKELEKESETVTYESLKDADLSEDTAAPATRSWKERLWWWPYIVNQPFGKSFFSLIADLLHHSRPRTFSIDGTIGLSQPHETGWLSALLYATIPASISELNFNFIEEEFDFRCCANGRLHPAVLLAYTTLFISSRPARNLIRCWFKKRKENNHG
jgi:hypothetical protein